MAFGDFTVTRASTKNILGSNGLYQSVANNVPAFEFNTDGSYRGLLVEPGATNTVRNNSMAGAVAGTPGTLPTNWITTDGGLTREIVGTGTEGGITYIDIRYSGTASATTIDFRFESNTGIVASSGQTWSQSYWVRLMTSPTPPTGYFHQMFERTAAGAFVTSGSTSFIATTSLARYTFTRTLSGGGTVERVQPSFGANVVNGNTYDFTIRIGWPQMETGSVATSPIVTTGSTASRVADVVTLTGASSLIGQTAGTIFFDGFIEKRNDSAFALAISNGASLSEAIYIQQATSGNISGLIRSGGNTLNLTFLSANWTAGRAKVAVVYEAGTNKCVICVNGGTPVKGTATAIPTCGIVTIGSRADSPGGLAITNAVGTVALFPTPLTDAQIIALTTL
jgi:hypothetical protein